MISSPAMSTTKMEMQTESVPLTARLAQKVGKLLCGLRGHDSVLHYEGKRMMMRCTSCGHDTPGWDVTGRPPRKRFDGARHTA